MSKEEKKSDKITKKRKTPLLKILMVAILVVLIGAFAFLGFKYYKLNNKYKNILSSEAAYKDARDKTVAQNNDSTIKKVSKLIAVPKDEEPKIFEVQDKDKLGSAKVTKTYFENAQKGDVILAYEKANVSIIYRPSENRIIKSDNYTNFYAAANPIKIAIIAPSKQQQDTENLILSKVINADITTKSVPKYPASQSFVIDATGQNAKAAKDLADKIGLGVGQLPEGESKPEGALLIVYMATPGNTASTP